MVWLIEHDEEIHPILGIALGETDEVVMRVPVAVGSDADGSKLSELELDIEPGFQILAIKRDGRYRYQPRRYVQLRAGDELIASGPDEGRPLLAERCGWRFTQDEETGETQLQPLLPIGSRSSRE
jgi:uncharacterized protein with PhoU and TrkA domain